MFIILLFVLFFFLSSPCLCVCVWRWSRDLSRGSRCESRWERQCIVTERGRRWGIFLYVLFHAFCNKLYDVFSLLW